MSGSRLAETGPRGRLCALLRDGDRILVATGPSEPTTLIEALLEAADDRQLSLELVQVLTGSREQILSAPARHKVRPIVAGRGRSAHPDRIEVLPMSMWQLARAINSGEMPIDGVLFSGRQLDVQRVNLGICIDIIEVACERARFRAVEINQALPLVPSPAEMPLDRCEIVIRTEQELLAKPMPVRGPVAEAIGGHLACLVPDGSCLEIGVGRSLSALPEALSKRNRHVSVHSGLVDDATRALVESGVADQPLACAGGAVAVGTAAMGSADFYRWLDRRGSIRLVDSRHAHDPCHLVGLGSFVAINAASRVDCTGQVGAGVDVAGRLAVGGLLDFAVAGSYGGLSIVALESVDGQGDSRLVHRLPAVQLPASLVTHVVTEYGVARLSGRTWSERAREMIAVAHPDHRAGLRREIAQGEVPDAHRGPDRHGQHDRDRHSD